MSSEPVSRPPSADLPVPTVRWEGLVVVVDASTLNTLVRKAARHVREIREILIEPEDGRIGLTVRVKRWFSWTVRSHLTSLRFKDGFLGFCVADLTVLRYLPVPSWVLRKIVDHQPPGRAFFYSDDRIAVLNLNAWLPPELSVQIRDVVCENGEMRVVFGPSQYRLDRLIEEMGRDPFERE